MSGAFDRGGWRQHCEAVAVLANHGCELVCENYEFRFTEAINQELPLFDHVSKAEAIRIAANYGYADETQLRESEAMLAG